MLLKNGNKMVVNHGCEYPDEIGRIGIGITTHNRYNMLKKTLIEIKRRSPPGAIIVIVDDASHIPVSEATFRFEKNVGIARAKNKCFELLSDCEHIFLFDDDTFPLRSGWWRPYVESNEPHLLYMFEHFISGRRLNDAGLIYEDGQIQAWSHGRGCMLYFEHRCLEVVGGMDPIFGRWGYEHIELSSRIYNAGLTSFKFMDVYDSRGLFWSADEHEIAQSSVSGTDRQACLQHNRLIWERLKDSARFVPYIDTPAVKTGSDVVITCFFVKRPDPERGKKWDADYSALLPLINSLEGQQLIILHDCFYQVTDTDYVKHVRIASSQVPYWQRWISIYQWLIRHPEVGRAFCVDATDVEMLRNPFPEMEDRLLYAGDEDSCVGNVWMRHKHPAESVQRFIDANDSHRLLNAGLLGGRRELLLQFIGAMLEVWGNNVADVRFGKAKTVGHSDMGVFNQVLLTCFAEKLSYGKHVNTAFKANEYNDVSWWKHK